MTEAAGLSEHLVARELPTGSISVERKDDSPEAAAAMRELVVELLRAEGSVGQVGLTFGKDG